MAHIASNTEKAKQHYVPKFYLRNFSYRDNKKQIGIFNIEKAFYHSTATIRDEGCKAYFYGKDGEIENALSDIEGVLADIVKRICNSSFVPREKTQEHFELLYFILLTEFRNPVMVDNISDGLRSMLKETYFKDKVFQDYINTTESQRSDSILTALQGIVRTVENCRDLNFKLIKNTSNTPFISSDNPVIKYNQFLESKNSMASTNGIANRGIQMFTPLNDSTMIVFYDSWAYKIGNRKQKIIEVKSENEVDQLNMLHFLNCKETIYFNHRASKTYINALFEKSKKFERSNIVKTIRIPDKSCMDSNKKNAELIITHFSDCRTRLSLCFIKMKDDAKKCILDGRLAYPRSNYQR